MYVCAICVCAHSFKVIYGHPFCVLIKWILILEWRIFMTMINNNMIIATIVTIIALMMMMMIVIIVLLALICG